MTTVAFKDGIMAADTIITCGDVIVGESQKIYVNENFCVSGCGHAGSMKYFLLFLSDGKDRKFDECSFMFWDFEKEQLFGNDNGVRNFLYTDKFSADGSGNSIAMGAMEAGASAIEAIEAAIKRDIKSGGRVIAYDCRKREWIREF